MEEWEKKVSSQFAFRAPAFSPLSLGSLPLYPTTLRQAPPHLAEDNRGQPGPAHQRELLAQRVDLRERDGAVVVRARVAARERRELAELLLEELGLLAIVRGRRE